MIKNLFGFRARDVKLEPPKSILDEYNMKPPSHQNALDIFKDEWATRLPGDYVSGTIPLFEDGRIHQIEQELGSFSGLDILELGPLEGGHTAMMLNSGASSVFAIEANQRAYLKCLIAKEIFGFPKASFMLGDFNEYLRRSDKKFDFILSCGVIYHMENPVETLSLILNNCNSVGIWSHYYSERVHQDRNLKDKFLTGSQILSGGGIDVRCYRQVYRESLNKEGFCGGAKPWSFWIPQTGWFEIFDHHGFELKIIEEMEDHPHGPAFTAFGRRR
jgi:hypothetical protein